MDKITHTEIAQEVLLAEFSALRDEIIQLEQWQSNVFALQLTAVAAIFSFSLSSHSRTGFLLILPVLSYALTRRYLEIEAGIYRISDYIIEELSPKTNGGLGWEEWNRERMDSTSSQWPKITRWISPVPFV